MAHVESDFHASFVTNLLPKIEYKSVLKAARSIGAPTEDLPEELPEEMPPTEAFLRALHRVLLETDVVQANMVCGGCGHVYPIKDSIPNMLLQDDEA